MQGVLPLVKGDGLAVHLSGELYGFVKRAVGHDDGVHPARDEALGTDATHFTSADEHDTAFLERAEHFLRQLHGHTAHGGGAALDGGFFAHQLADVKGTLEEFVEESPGYSGLEGAFVGGFDLAKNLSFPKHHAVQPTDDSEEVSRGLLGSEAIADEALGLIGREVEVLLQVAAKAGVAIHFVLGSFGGVDLHAVAGGNDDSFLKARQPADLLERGGQLSLGKGHSLP